MPPAGSLVVAVEGSQQRSPVHGAERGLRRGGLQVADAAVTAIQVQRSGTAGGTEPAAVGRAGRRTVARVAVDHCRSRVRSGQVRYPRGAWPW